MAEHRPFPPSPRRRALARRAGLVAASPHLVAGGAWLGALVGLVIVARGAGAQIGGWIASACRASDGGPASLTLDALAEAIGAIALPLLAATALAAFAAHVAQTRTLWIPRRRIPGAPTVPTGRGRHAALDLGAAIAIGAVAFAWLWRVAPQLAALSAIAPSPGPVAALIAAMLATLALARVATGAVDALVRTAETTGALHMTATEKREDDRLAAADPRWRDRRRATSPAEAMPGASLLLLGDDHALAIAWDPVRRPIPTRLLEGRGARATQLLGLARRHRVPVHRDAALATALAGEGPVPERDWPRLAEIIAAVRRL